jgi:hypothetical protein
MNRNQRRAMAKARQKHFDHVAGCPICSAAPYDMNRLPVRKLHALCPKGRETYKVWNDMVTEAWQEELRFKRMENAGVQT